MKLEYLIDGSLLGDGAICKSYDRRQDTYNYYFSEGHSLKQEEYLRWKGGVFAEAGFNVSYRVRNKTPRIKGRTITSTEVSFHVCSNSYFKPIREMWYPSNIKQVPGDISLTPESLAVWYMDDGTYHMFRGTISLCTYGFNKQSQHLLQRELSKFGINAAVAQKGSGKDKSYYIYLSRTEAHKLVSLVESYIHADLSYKVPKGYELFSKTRKCGRTLSTKLPSEEAKTRIVDSITQFERDNGEFHIIPYLFWEEGYSHKPIQRVFGSFEAALIAAGLRYSPCC